jgi:hypothetical protein
MLMPGSPDRGGPYISAVDEPHQDRPRT